MDIARGHQPVVADFDEALGQDVHEKATDKLFWGQCDGVLAPGDEGDAVIIHGDQAVIGDGDPVGVAAEVFEDLLRATEGPFGIDDPFCSIQLVHEMGEQGWVGQLLACCGECELSIVVSPTQGIEELATEQRAEDLTGEEVSVQLCGDPAISGWSQSSAGDDAVQMKVRQKLAGPCMQHRGNAELGAEKPVVVSEIEQGFRGGCKEGVEEPQTVVHGQGPELAGQGEDGMEVVSGQEALFALGDPFGLSQALALRAVTVSAGVV